MIVKVLLNNVVTTYSDVTAIQPINNGQKLLITRATTNEIIKIFELINISDI